jgi:hypothetical protein
MAAEAAQVAARERVPDIMKRVLSTILDEDGNYRFICFLEDDESDSESESEVMTGGGPGDKRRRAADAQPSEDVKKRRIDGPPQTAPPPPGPSIPGGPKSRKKPAAVPAVAPAAVSANYRSHIDDDTRRVLTNDPTIPPEEDYNVAETILLLLGQDKFPALLGLSRAKWEIPKPPGQCAAAGKGADLPCWLCNNPVGMGQGGTTIAGKRMSVCSRLDNQYECEHVLPGVFMLFLRMLINKTRIGPIDANIQELYDSSCHICNTVKSDGLYVKAKWAGTGSDLKLVFEPDSEKIMVDVLTFILSTRIGETTEITRVDKDDDLPPYPGLPMKEVDKKDIVRDVESKNGAQRQQAIAAAPEFVPYIPSDDARHKAERDDAIGKGVTIRDLASMILSQPGGSTLNRSTTPLTTPDWPSPVDEAPICSGRPAVHFYSSKAAGDEIVVERSTITSITVAAPLIPPADDPQVVALNTALTTYLTSSIGAPPETIPSPGIERTAAFSVSPRFNNLTRAVIEHIDVAGQSLPPPSVLVPAPDYTLTAIGNLVIPKLEYLLRGKSEVRKLGWLSVIQPQQAAAAAAAAAAPPVIGLDLSESGTATTKAARLASLRASGIPLRVDLQKAEMWIRSRFGAIFRRMRSICEEFNKTPVNRQIVGYAQSLATTPLLTPANVTLLGAVPNLPPRTGGLRFTIRRRSETRQTKKNRMRKPRVIEVNI